MKKIKNRFDFKTICVVSAALIISGCTSFSTHSETDKTRETLPALVASEKKDLSKTVEAGDLIKVNYTMRLDSGDVFFTTDKTIADNSGPKKAEWFQPPEKFGPVEVLAGKDAELAEIAKDVVGMELNGQKTVTLLPEKGFGKHDPKKVKVLPKIKIFPKLASVKPKDYVLKFNSFPVVGRYIDFTPYYKSKVVEVNEGYVILQAQTSDWPAEKKSFEADYGTTVVKTVGDEIHVVLEPRISAPFKLNGMPGKIVKTDKETFTVDCNHPGAGREIILEMEVAGIKKSHEFIKQQLLWIEDDDSGLKMAEAENKPVILVLYAGWCSWSKKLIDETVQDPRVQKLWDRFVWVKINSDEEREYKELYNQKGFPLVIILGPDGEILNRIDGYRHPQAFLRELQICLKKIKP